MTKFEPNPNKILENSQKIWDVMASQLTRDWEKWIQFRKLKSGDFFVVLNWYYIDPDGSKKIGSCTVRESTFVGAIDKMESILLDMFTEEQR